MSSIEPVKSGCEVIYEMFQASVRNCLNCVQNCDDHGLLDFKSAVQSIYETFHISLHITIIILQSSDRANAVLIGRSLVIAHAGYDVYLKY